MLSIFVLGTTCVWGQEEFDQNTLNWLGASRAGVALSNVDLPAHIPAPSGRLTLYADYAARNERGIPIYLVNRTASPIRFRSQDRRLYVFLERATFEGKWERAQPYRSSTCGNSYYSVTLLPGQHFALFGYQPAQGEKSKIRFALSDQDLSTEEGEGLVAMEDLEFVRRDVMARSAPGALQIAMDERIDPYRSQSPQQRVAAVRLLQVYGGGPFYKEAAEKIAVGWETKPSPSADEVKGAKAIREILLQPWTSEASAEELVARCQAALQSGQSEMTGFGLPEGDPAFVWGILGELAERDQKNDAQKWRPVVEFALKNPSPINVAGLIRIARVPWIAEELLPDAFFEKVLAEGDSAAQLVAAETLSRRTRWNRLAEIGKGLSPASQLIVLRALAYPKSGDPDGRTFARDAEQRVESVFWEHCMAMQPLKAAQALRYGRSSEYNSFNRLVHDPLRDFLREEAVKGASAAEDFDLGQDAAAWLSAVEFLGSWKMEEDVEVLRKLLEYRGYQKSEGSSGGKSFVRHFYGVRRVAKNALAMMGQAVPENLVLEKEATE